MKLELHQDIEHFYQPNVHIPFPSVLPPPEATTVLTYHHRLVLPSSEHYINGII